MHLWMRTRTLCVCVRVPVHSAQGGQSKAVDALKLVPDGCNLSLEVLGLNCKPSSRAPSVPTC